MPLKKKKPNQSTEEIGAGIDIEDISSLKMFSSSFSLSFDCLSNIWHSSVLALGTDFYSYLSWRI